MSNLKAKTKKKIDDAADVGELVADEDFLGALNDLERERRVCSPRQPGHVALGLGIAFRPSLAKLVALRRVARPNEIPQGLLLGVGNPDCREIAAPKKARELFGGQPRKPAKGEEGARRPASRIR